MDKEDIVPELSKSIDELFKQRNSKSEVLKEMLKRLNDGTATYKEAGALAGEIGRNLSLSVNDVINEDVLPDGKMYFNISNRLLNHSLKNNYEIVSGFSTDVQNLINQNAGLHLKVQVPKFNDRKVKGLVERLSNAEDFETAEWLLKEPLITFTQSIVDDYIQKNIKFQSDAGLNPKLTRTVIGNPCAWCKNLAGNYEYNEAPEDIFRRHDRCRCIVDYLPGDGKKQNVWSKEWK